MMPVTGGMPCACATSGTSAAASTASVLFTTLPQLVQRNEFVAFRAHAVHEPLERAHAEFGAREHRMPEKGCPGVADDFVGARDLEHALHVLGLAAVAR